MPMLPKVPPPTACEFGGGRYSLVGFERPVFGPGPVLWVGVVLEGDQVAAAIGRNLVVGCAGFGPTIPDALRDLAAALEREGIRMGPLAPGNTGSLHLVKSPAPAQE